MIRNNPTNTTLSDNTRLNLEPSGISPAQAVAPIQHIARQEFNQLLPQHLDLENLMGKQIKWFTNKAKTLIGTIAVTAVGRSWNFVVLRRNKQGNFQVCEAGQNFFNLVQTIVQFKFVMVAAKNSRQVIYRTFSRAVARFKRKHSRKCSHQVVATNHRQSKFTKKTAADHIDSAAASPYQSCLRLSNTA